MPTARNSVSILLGGACGQACTVCDCTDTPVGSTLPTLLRAGGDRLVLRGEPINHPAFGAVLQAARPHWNEIWIRTNGSSVVQDTRAADLRSRGVRGAIVPMFSQVASVHDAIAHRSSSLVTALRAMRALDREGLSVSTEFPILSPKLQDLAAMVDLAHRTVPSLSELRTFVPERVQPPTLAPPPAEVMRVALEAAADACRQRSIAFDIRDYDGVPLCVLGHSVAYQTLYRFNPRRPARPRRGRQHVAACEPCAVRTFCPGPTVAWSTANQGQRGLLQSFGSRPRAMFEQRTTPRRRWTDVERKAAGQQVLRVLRPTIHCNQDCPFCSANETSQEITTDPAVMYRRIARIARAGVRRLSFGGGEPTMSRHLVDYVRVASRLGIEIVEIVTNGVLIDSVEKVRPLVSAGLTDAFVSLHAHDELLARRSTNKIGDWTRTVRAIDALVELGVRTELNHVLTTINYEYTHRFAEMVSQRWKGKAGVSFAFVTPQYRSLENPWLIPRISDVMPYLRKAMRRLADDRVHFVVGSRQGIPPCFLREYEGWSDVLDLVGPAVSEDQHQKTKAEQCSSCKYDRFCTGLWKPYVARYGSDELHPVTGVITEEDIAEVARTPHPICGFEGLPAPFRAQPVDDASEVPEPEFPPRVSLPVLGRSVQQRVRGSGQRLRVAMFGSGHQAQRLSRVIAAGSTGLELVGVASPHLRDRDPGMFASVPRYSSPEDLLDRERPDAVIVASATVAHHELAILALERKLPVLVEKPIARTRAEADALVERVADGGVVMTSHPMLFSPGVAALRALRADGTDRDPTVRASCSRQFSANGVEALPRWGRDGIYQLVYHCVYLLGALTGSTVFDVQRVATRGASRPEWLRVEMTDTSNIPHEIVLDFESSVDETDLSGTTRTGLHRGWRRVGADEFVTRGTSAGDRTTSVERGSDTEGMLVEFARVCRTRRVPLASASDARDVMVAAQRIVDALASVFTRADAPKHVTSPGLRG